MPKLNRPSALNSNADSGHHVSRLVIFSIVGSALCWFVISHGVVAYLSKTAPQTALWLRGDEPTSLLLLAEDEINFGAGDKGKMVDPPQHTQQRLQLLRGQVETALLIDPLPSRAYRLLGQIANDEDLAQKAETLMLAATRHSLKESFAVNWMMWKNFERKDYPIAAYYADALLCSGGGYLEYVAPILARMAEDNNGKKEVEKLLAANPSWRRAFLNVLGTYVTDARTPFYLFLGLKDTQAPATAEELNSYQSFLFQHKLYALAYYVWRQFLPLEELAATGSLFNGDFEVKPSGSAFDWWAPAGANVVVDFASRTENALDHALVVEFGPGRVEFPGVYQTTVLPPGAYSFKGSLKGEVVGPRGVVWDISCRDGASLGQSEMLVGSFPDWRAFEFSLVVPKTNCPAQLVKLKLVARSPSEQLVSGAIWFDELSISRQKEKTFK
ncbi:MAG: hypothetical protein WB816_07360 [Methylocystis sp.]